MLHSVFIWHMLCALHSMVGHHRWSKTFSLNLLIIIFSLNTCYAFDAGFLQLASTPASNEDTTHYAITVCALSRVTIDYIKTVNRIDVTYLESRFNQTNGQCRGNIVHDIVYTLINSQSFGLNPSQFDGTVKTIAAANTKTDLKEALEADSHFDNEEFRGGSQLILKRYQATIDSILREDNYDQARNTFGEMLHTLQVSCNFFPSFLHSYLIDLF